MKVEANATRVINKRGNQVLIVTGSVLSENLQGVLPAGKEYDPDFLELSVKGGAVHFSFQVEAAEPAVPIAVPVPPAELTHQEQEQLFLASQLKRDDLTPEEKQAITEKLLPVEDKHITWPSEVNGIAVNIEESAKTGVLTPIDGTIPFVGMEDGK